MQIIYTSPLLLEALVNLCIETVLVVAEVILVPEKVEIDAFKS